MAEAESGVTEFETYRTLLLTIAYRMLGSAAEAEDLVQEAYLRFADTERSLVRDVKAFLVTILTRLALDRLKSAQKQRETYVGEWLPEPVLTGIDGDPLAAAARGEEVHFALLRAMERLSPQERAVLVLHEVLEHDHQEIAEMLDITAAASRQLLHRARQRVAAEKKRFHPTPEEQERLVLGFAAAVRDGDVETLRSILLEDVISRSDGGGRVPGAGMRPVVGAENVIRLYSGLLSKAPAGFSISLAEINGAQGLLTWIGNELLSAMVFAFDGPRIAEISSILNPQKLQALQRQRSRAIHQVERRS